MTKIRYIETKPIAQVLEFEDNQAYNEFISKRIKEILDYTYPNNFNFYEYFKYERVLLNKNGLPRKKVDSNQWLHSPEARKKQKERFAEWCEKRKQMTAEISFRRKKAQIETKIILWKKELEELENARIS